MTIEQDQANLIAENDYLQAAQKSFKADLRIWVDLADRLEKENRKLKRERNQFERMLKRQDNEFVRLTKQLEKLKLKKE